MFYVISPPSPTAWRATRDDLERLLEQRWPGTVVEAGETSTNTRAITWQLRLPTGALDLAQHRNGTAHYLNGPLQAIADYAAWWRAQVPTAQPLQLYDETYSTVVALTPGATAEDILQQCDADVLGATELINGTPQVVAYADTEVPLTKGTLRLHAARLRGEALTAACGTAQRRLLPTGHSWFASPPGHLDRCGPCAALYPIAGAAQ